MKKIVAIALLIILAYNFIGLTVVFKAIRMRMKSEFLQSLSKNLNNRSLTVICYSPETKAGFSILEEHELCYNGDMYDIVKVEQKDGKRIFYCVSDKAETRLITNMENSIAGGMNRPDNSGVVQTFMLLLGFYMLPDTNIHLYAPEAKKLFAGSIIQSNDSPYIGLHLPPPKIG